jgi:hypothetical protein
MIDIAVPIKSWRFVAVHEKRKEGTYPSISCSKVQNADSKSDRVRAGIALTMGS